MWLYKRTGTYTNRRLIVINGLWIFMRVVRKTCDSILYWLETRSSSSILIGSKLMNTCWKFWVLLIQRSGTVKRSDKSRRVLYFKISKFPQNLSKLPQTINATAFHFIRINRHSRLSRVTVIPQRNLMARLEQNGTQFSSQWKEMRDISK